MIESRKKKYERQRSFLSGFSEISAKEFVRTKNEMPETTGVYIIYNKTKNLHYVGQSVRVIQRLANHFAGRGNGDVYADYKYGDTFSVKIIPLNKSNYNTLDDLERVTIETCNSYSRGYNKTRGNNVRR